MTPLTEINTLSKRRKLYISSTGGLVLIIGLLKGSMLNTAGVKTLTILNITGYSYESTLSTDFFQTKVVDLIKKNAMNWKKRWEWGIYN